MSESPDTTKRERPVTEAEQAVALLKERLLYMNELTHVSGYCKSLTVKGGSAGIKIVGDSVLINANGDPDGPGSTSYSFAQDGSLEALEAMTPTRVCGATEEAQFVAVLTDPNSVQGELSIELAFPRE